MLIYMYIATAILSVVGAVLGIIGDLAENGLIGGLSVDTRLSIIIAGVFMLLAEITKENA